MKIDSIEVRELKLDLKHPFETSFARVSHQRFLLLRLSCDGVVGWSECVADETPSYSPETVRSCWAAIEDFVAPVVFATDYEHPSEIAPSLSRIRGNNMAKAAVEMGCWDVFARQRNEPLSKTLGGTRLEILSGVSIGIQEDIDQLFTKIETELAAGYRRIKLKIKPGWDVDILRRVRERFPDILLMADANSAYTLDDIPLFKEMDQFELMMFEQPLHYEDIWDHAKLQKEINTPICLDESIHSVDDARQAIEMEATRIINIKPGRVGGHQSSRDIQSLCAGHGIPVWCGGMLESGVGRAHNVHLSTLENFTLPGDVSDSNRYFVEEIIEPRVEVRHDGSIEVPSGPGIGYEVTEQLVDKYTVTRKTLTP